jgi:hypothetical protein
LWTDNTFHFLRNDPDFIQVIEKGKQNLDLVNTNRILS